MNRQLVQQRFVTLFYSWIDAGTSATPLYTLIDPTVTASELDYWNQHFPKYDNIVGYSHLGHFFLQASFDGEYVVLYPLSKVLRTYGVFANIADFEKSVLKDPAFSHCVLQPKHIAALNKRLGSLKNSEVYIPEPYQNSDKPEAYSKCDIWVFMKILAQMHKSFSK